MYLKGAQQSHTICEVRERLLNDMGLPSSEHWVALSPRENKSRQLRTRPNSTYYSIEVLNLLINLNVGA